MDEWIGKVDMVVNLRVGSIPNSCRVLCSASSEQYTDLRSKPLVADAIVKFVDQVVKLP